MLKIQQKDFHRWTQQTGEDEIFFYPIEEGLIFEKYKLFDFDLKCLEISGNRIRNFDNFLNSLILCFCPHKINNKEAYMNGHLPAVSSGLPKSI